ncbi:hypothetical protein [Paenibacillus whitsoniae]|uniref:hypothetical protein n=1 Tax=Paenibacillus whitsoniae TaxID=2496558 RepID=UPI0013E0AC40|nr:hypothetical protein [Paenibacillus whitsoniae]
MLTQSSSFYFTLQGALPYEEEGNDIEGTVKNLPPRGVVESYLYKAGDVDYWM